MANFLSSAIAVSILICIDVFLRHDLVYASPVDYSIACLLLLGFIFICRSLLHRINSSKLRLLVAVFAIILFSLIYWLQSAVYKVYFQFINAADIGIVLGNLKYWSQSADSLLTIINLNYLFAYILIFSFVFLVKAKHSSHDQQKSKTKTVLAMLVLLSVMAGCGFYIKQNQLYYLTTPVISLSYEFKKFFAEKDRFIKPISQTNQQGYYPRQTDDIAAINRRGDFNVLFLLLESLRYDHMSLYGYERDTTPFQRQRFSEAIHFEHAVSNATSTDTSVESIFTGMDWTNPQLHETSLLWSYLQAAKLNQFYVGSHWLKWNGWFGRAFLSEDVDSIQSPLAVDASLTGYDMISARKFKKTLAQFAHKDEPFFGVVHFAGTHYPYVSPVEHAQWLPADDKFEPNQVDQLINKYNNAIRYNDDAVKSVIQELDKLGLRDNTIIIVTADHAEAMYEHKQFFHGKVFWQEGIHVPLYIDIPDALRKKFTREELDNLASNRKRFVSLVDLFPTILDLYNIPLSKAVDGFSLLKPYPRELIRIYMVPEEYALINSHTGEKYHIDNSKKLLRYTKLRDDPGEMNSLKMQLDQFVSIDQIRTLIESGRIKTSVEQISINNK